MSLSIPKLKPQILKKAWKNLLNEKFAKNFFVRLN